MKKHRFSGIIASFYWALVLIDLPPFIANVAQGDHHVHGWGWFYANAAGFCFVSAILCTKNAMQGDK